MMEQEYILDFSPKVYYAIEEWKEFFTESKFTFFIPPNIGDTIDLFSFCNKDDKFFMQEFEKVFNTKYVKITNRILTTNSCVLQVEPISL